MGVDFYFLSVNKFFNIFSSDLEEFLLVRVYMCIEECLEVFLYYVFNVIYQICYCDN